MTTSRFQSKTLAVLILCLVLVACLGVIGYLSYLERNRSVAVYEELAELRAKKREVEGMKVLLSELAPAQKVISAYFISPTTVSTVIEELERLGKLAKVQFALSSAKLVETPKNQLELAFRVEGTFAQLQRFLGLVGHMPFEVIFTSGQLKAGEAGKPWSGQFSLIVESFETQK